jgi:hypothetical protein
MDWQVKSESMFSSMRVSFILGLSDRFGDVDMLKELELYREWDVEGSNVYSR